MRIIFALMLALVPKAVFTDPLPLCRLTIPFDIGLEFVAPMETSSYHLKGDVRELGIQISYGNTTDSATRHMVFNDLGCMIEFRTSYLDNSKTTRYVYDENQILKEMVVSSAENSSQTYIVESDYRDGTTNLSFTDSVSNEVLFVRRISITDEKTTIWTNASDVTSITDFYFSLDKLTSINETTLLSEISPFVKDVTETTTIHYSSSGTIVGYDRYKILFDYSSNDPSQMSNVPGEYAKFTSVSDEITRIDVFNCDNDTLMNSYHFYDFDSQGNWQRCELYNVVGLEQTITRAISYFD